MYHSVLAFQSDALIMAMDDKVTPEGVIHTVNNARPKVVGLSATGKAEVAINNLLDMLQCRQVRQGIGNHAVQYLTEVLDGLIIVPTNSTPWLTGCR